AREVAEFQSSTREASWPTLVDLFRARKVFAFEPDDAAARFETSGTTSAQSGRPYFRTTATYARLSVEWGRLALVNAKAATPHVVALMPDPAPAYRSSLAFMCERFMREFDTSVSGPNDAALPTRWLLSDEGVHLAGLRRHI